MSTDTDTQEGTAYVCAVCGEYTEPSEVRYRVGARSNVEGDTQRDYYFHADCWRALTAVWYLPVERDST